MEAHESQAKPFTIWPLLTDSENPRQVEIRLHSLSDDDGLVERIHIRLAEQPGRLPNLGRDIPLLDPTVTVEKEGWDDLATASRCTRVDVELIAPMSYSRNGVFYPLPDPILVHRQLETRWNDYAPRQLLSPA